MIQLNMNKTFIRYLTPHIKIHVWGGFGSQLFALVMAWRISSKFKCRRVRLVFHSSGVTERIRELPSEWLQNISFIEVRDFANTLPSKKPSQSKIAVKIDKARFLGILLFSGILARANSDKELNQLKPWVLEVRGHYADLQVNDIELSRLRTLMGIDLEGTEINCCSVHYRLGDLIHLEGKSYISPKRIQSTLDNNFDQKLPVNIFSDSKEHEVTKLLQYLLDEKRTSYFALSPIETIKFCFYSREFLGTNSKISLWIAIFRLHGASRLTAIPSELNNQLNAQRTAVPFQSKLLTY
jgi:hypothetical protein